MVSRDANGLAPVGLPDRVYHSGLAPLETDVGEDAKILEFLRPDE